MERKLKLLALAPYCDGLDVGEAWCAFQWIRHLAKDSDLTLLTLRRPGRVPVSEQLPDVEVVEWKEPSPVLGAKRLNSMLKPGYLAFYAHANKWIQNATAEGRKFDVGHQFSPIALRYPTPLAQHSIPYVIGPLGGSLQTPPGFVKECSSSAWYTRLRSLDRWRLRHDRVLKHSFRKASALLGVAPYVGELLSPSQPQRFEVMSELGIDELAPARPREMVPGKLKLVHIGRGVRTKGLRDAVRAIALLPDTLNVQLVAAGQGEEIDLCRAEAQELGVSDRIQFLGQVSRDEVEILYEEADAFLFPSFREPSGSVIFEALRHGLPVITTTVGGPGYVVDETCGLTVPVHAPNQFSRDLADAITRLAIDAGLRGKLSAGARSRVRSIGLWRNKAQWLFNLYGEVTAQHHSKPLEVH